MHTSYKLEKTVSALPNSVTKAVILFWVHVWLCIWHHSCKHNPTLILKTMSAKSSLLITD